MAAPQGEGGKPSGNSEHAWMAEQGSSTMGGGAGGGEVLVYGVWAGYCGACGQVVPLRVGGYFRCVWAGVPLRVGRLL